MRRETKALVQRPPTQYGVEAAPMTIRPTASGSKSGGATCCQAISARAVRGDSRCLKIFLYLSYLRQPQLVQ